MTPSVQLALMLLALQQYATVSGSVDEFQCACGYDAAHHVRVARITLAGRGVTAAAGLAAGYGPLVSRMLFVASNRPEPTARWLWLLHLYANGATQQLEKMGRRQSSTRWFARAVYYVGQELDRYLTICKSRGLGSGGLPWRDQKSFVEYVLDNAMTIDEKQLTGGFARMEDFAPRWLYLNYVATDDDALRAGGVMPLDVGIDWRSTADQLTSLFRKAVSKWVFGTRELVLYQKKFIATVVATLMGHVLVHIEHCRSHRLLAMAQPLKTAEAHTDTSVAADTAVAAADIGKGQILNDGGGLVGEYELMWMSVGALLEKYKSYLALGPEKYYRTLVEVAANPTHDDRGFRLTRRVIETHIDELGAGMFGLAATNWTAVAEESAAENPQTLIELIALVDNNISTAEKYLKNVQELLSNVDFKIVNKFMRSTHIWLL